MGRSSVVGLGRWIRGDWAILCFLCILAVPGFAAAQPQPLCVPGTPVCARAGVNGSVQASGSAQGQAGASPSATVNANANGNASAGANAGASGNANAGANAGASGNANAGGRANGNVRVDAGANPNVRVDVDVRHPHVGVEGRGTYSGRHTSYPSEPTRFGAGVAFCGTLKVGVLSGYKAGPCFAVSFRTEPLTFEMETQLLFGGTRHSIDWVFPMSFVIPLTSQWSLYEGLQLRVGGSPIGVTFAKAKDGGSYIRFGLHAGLSYEWGLSRALSWRVFDARAFLDFGTKREVDLHQNFLDFGAQLGTGIVF